MPEKFPVRKLPKRIVNIFLKERGLFKLTEQGIKLFSNYQVKYLIRASTFD